ncbi:LPP20 family lipoprotein [bacterium]|nr:LPP20 family lipoprotein [bacterium]
MKFLRLALMLALVVILIGCGASQQQTGITPKATQETMEAIPGWFLNPPEDPNFIIATGTATSRDLQLARDKAGDAARMDIAKTIETKFNGLSKRFQEEVGTGEDAQYLDQFTQATKAVVSTVLSGATIDKTEVKNEQGTFRVYVLMKMPIGASSEALLNKLKQQEQLYTRFRASETFKDLEAETQKFDEWKKAE